MHVNHIKPMINVGDRFPITLPEINMEVEVEVTDKTDKGIFFKPTSGTPLPTTSHVPDHGYFSSWSNVIHTF